MNRPRPPRAPTRTLGQFEHTRDLESVITTSLAARPIDGAMLRRSVCAYVSEERHAGTPSGRIILALTELIGKAKATSEMERQAVIRRVILWSVEAYFGPLGDEVGGPAAIDAAP